MTKGIGLMAKERLVTKARSPAAPTAPAPGGFRSLLTFIFRLLLLGVSVSGAWLAGVIVAEYYPDQSQSPPLQEIVLRRSSRVIQRIQRLSELWRQSAISPRNLEPRFSPAGSVPQSSPTITSNPDVPAPLSAAEQQQVKQTLVILETELQGLSRRTANVENRMGQAPSNLPLERRLQALNQQISSQSASVASGDSGDAANQPASNPASAVRTDSVQSPDGGAAAAPTEAISAMDDPLFQVTVLKITLPSDLLFERDQGRLKAEAASVLDSIVPDLGRYPGAAVLIGAHTDNQKDVNFSRELSFQQATAIQQHLAKTLGHSFHLVSVGYGQTEPIASTDSSTDLERNRRIEITIDPR